MTARDTALKILYEIDKNGAYTGAEIKKRFSNCDISQSDKSLATELVYGVVKNRTRLDYIVSKYSTQKIKKISVWIINILRMGIYQILFLDKIPVSAAVDESVKLAKRYGHQASAGFVNGVLRNVGRNGDVEYPDGKEYYEVFYSHPKWLVDMLFDQYGDDAEKIIKGNCEILKTTVRVNVLKTSTENVAESLNAKGIKTEFTEEKNILKISGYGSISSLDEYKNGLITPQGLSSYKAAKTLDVKENDVVIDMCSAPGGKATAMAEMCGDKSMIYAFDIYSHKIDIINKNCKRLGIKNIYTQLADSSEYMEEFKNKADKVIADVPCSGIGIIRKKPDIKWNKDTNSFDEIIKVQRKILETAHKYLKQGGILVYSTCTLNKDENEKNTLEFAD
ncbi:MAG: 16S rRNA (cytosine(967)-C(5))-methyltransferase RsmB, partial [Clostridia bacterium]|nr:16S rRNA (cytosine(967)-C(5))-methyltransferase RsmB [Clostridia bacterium]